MTKFTAKPERTYGLIVGIEQYQEKKWNVNGPVNDAIEFASCLLLRGVPKGNLRLCLSPFNSSSELVQKFNLNSEPATEQNLFEIITNDMSQKQGDLLFIFWAGHGLINSERNRKLICADATGNNWQNLDFNSLLVLLGSDSFRIPHHICIVDACANYVLESKGRPTNLGGKKFPSGKPRKETQQFVLLAVRDGETAKVNSSEKTGYFSQAVREAFNQQISENSSDTWLPDMQVVADKVKQELASFDKRQQPTYWYQRSWDGDTDTFHFNPLDVPHNIPISQARKFVDREQPSEKLHELLKVNNIVAITDVTGEGGVGKTELATQYSWEHLEDYPGGCCWLKLQGIDIVTQLSEFAIVHDFAGFKIPEKLTLASQISYCWRNWRSGNVLLVLDNVTNIQQIQDYLPPMGSQFKVLITTRSSRLPYTSLPLGRLPDDAALELLGKLLGEELIQQELEFAQKLCQFSGCIPLGLYNIATAYYSKSGSA